MNETIAKVVIQAQKYVDKVILCDDGSTDYTSLIAERLGAEVIKHERNLGYGSAIRSLFLKARELKADVIVTIDSDGQHDPNEIPKLIKPILSGEADLVIGSRFMEGAGDESSIVRKTAIKGITKVVGVGEVKDSQSGFRAYNRKAIEAITPTEQGMGVSTEILMKANQIGLKIIEVPITVKYKGIRKSTQNPIFHLGDVLASTLKHISIRHPLIFYGTPAIILFLIGVFSASMTMKLYLAKGYFSIPFTLLAAIFLISSLLLFFTAVILFTLISVVKELK
ncbi:MAG: glycosyltransferase family 2 protein [Candidatus Bathyarchaeia archaeon]